MAKFIVSDVQYDTDGVKADLPNTIEIEISDSITDNNEIGVALRDEISKITGFTRFGFAFTKAEK